MRKRICFVTTIGLTIKSFLMSFSKYLVNERNYDVTFICAPDKDLEAAESEHIHFIPVAMARGVNFDAFRVISQLKKIFKEQQFDIVQYATPNAAVYASVAAKKTGVKNRLYTQWGIRYMGYDGGLNRMIFKWLEKLVCRNSSIIECESFSIQDFSVTEGLYPKTKSSVIGKGSACGVDLAKCDISMRDEWRNEVRSKLSIAKDTIVFGYTGRITRDKGLNELIEAFKIFNATYEDSVLLLVGDFDNEGTIRPELRKWAEESSSVAFTGWTPHAEMYYAAMDVFCSLSYREGFGLVVIEAAGMGLPGIVTNVPGQRDTIIDGETGISVPCKQVEPVVEAMKKYYNDRKMMRKMGANARKNVEDNFEQTKLFALLANHRDELI